MNDDFRKFGAPAGFTLLEVVVAMAIVGLGVVTLLQIFSLGLRLGAKSSVETESMAYGRQVMDEVLARPSIEEGATQGNIQDRGRWQLRIQRVNEPQRTLSLSSAWELKEVIVGIRLSDAGRERESELKTLRLVHKSSP
ncbi:MAG: type II secretion system GspH family protein [Deltaproteobacteria bacterium]|nr:type II secretion system GspH family protein [Deltaproteobacteria bacterium]